MTLARAHEDVSGSIKHALETVYRRLDFDIIDTLILTL